MSTSIVTVGEIEEWPHQSEERDLAIIMRANAISKKTFKEAPEKIHRIELLLESVPRLNAVRHFIGLVELEMINQNISKIAHLECCPLLETLFLNDNRIKRIENLQNNLKLKKLYIGGNQITDVSGIKCLRNLEVVHLHDNVIKQVDAVGMCGMLRCLWLAGNQISEIGRNLDALKHLEELNLAGNLISDLNEIRNLARLSFVKNLSLSEPHFGDNPVCNLCNYHTYALHYMSHLSELDAIKISDQAKRMALATYKKKLMYYSMKIKTEKRIASDYMKLANEAVNECLLRIDGYSTTAIRVLRDVECEIDERKHLGSEITSQNERLNSNVSDEDLAAKLDALNILILSHSRLKMQIMENVEDYEADIKKVTEWQIRRYVMELDTGGNIRFEDGVSTDRWYSSCCELIQSRFYPKLHNPILGIEGVQVFRVVRIHNRALRNFFDEMLVESLRSRSHNVVHEPDSRVEYVFFECSEGNVNLEQLTSKGFQVDNGTPIKFGSSLNVIDTKRISDATKKTGAGVKEFFTVPNITLICKVFVDGAKEIMPGGEGRSDAFDTRNIARYEIVTESPLQKQWYIKDPRSIVPEYLVSYVYTCASTTPHEEVTPYRETVFRPPSSEILKRLEKVETKIIAERYRQPTSQLMSSLTPIFGQDQEQGRQRLLHVIGAPPQLKQRTKVLGISKENLKKRACPPIDEDRANPNPETSVLYLNFHANNIQKIDNLQKYTCLQELVLSFNDIQTIAGLKALVLLRKLDLGYNLIRSIRGLAHLVNLEKLDLRHNLIDIMDDIKVLTSNASLENLDLSGNPITEIPGYRCQALQWLPSIMVLDASNVGDMERYEADNRTDSTTMELIYNNSFVHKSHSFQPPKPDYALSKKMKYNANKKWTHVVKEVSIIGKRIRHVVNFDKLVNLRKVDIENNFITEMKGFSSNFQLEQLNIANNNITKVEGLEKLLRLKKLGLGRNCIGRSLQDVMTFPPNLVMLSIEDNEIQSLSALSGLYQLMELYIANNKIKLIKEILHLRRLSKLIILDLSGNPLTKDPTYRVYLIYQLRVLKVLDGDSISVDEITEAKEKYTGRLTDEMLAEKIGHRYFEHIRVLDMSSCQIRLLEGLETCRFCNLRELSLDNNSISDLSPITRISSLVVLKINRNKIEKGPHLIPKVSEDPLTTEDGNSRIDHRLSSLKQLEVLQLGGNKIKSIHDLGISGMPQLRVLFLQENDIARVDGLDKLPQLRELVLDRNKIKIITPGAFSGCYNLRELRIEENGLKELANIGRLNRLQSLSVSYNRISELGQLQYLNDLPLLIEISINANPVARKGLYRFSVINKCPSIRIIDGVEVMQSEAERAELLFMHTNNNPNTRVLYNTNTCNTYPGTVSYAASPQQRHPVPNRHRTEYQTPYMQPKNTAPLTLQNHTYRNQEHRYRLANPAQLNPTFPARIRGRRASRQE